MEGDPRAMVIGTMRLVGQGVPNNTLVEAGCDWREIMKDVRGQVWWHA